VAGRGYGADIDLEKIHIAIKDLAPEVIACAETQERLCWVVHPELTQHVLRHYNEIWDLPSVAEGACASVVGTVNGSGVYRLRHRGQIVCEARSVDLTSGLQYVRPTKAVRSVHAEPSITCHGSRITLQQNQATRVPHADFSIAHVFRAMLAHPNGCSREPILKHYDKTVIGNTIIEAGEADAGVIQPLQDLSSHVHDGSHPGWDVSEMDRMVGVAVAADGNGRYGRISPYWQGANAVIESLRNIAAVGAVPRAITDCLNYGNPEIPGHLWAFEEGVRGIAEAASGVAIEGAPVPVISGNVSLYNSTPEGSAIDPTAVVCAIGVLSDATRAVNAQWKKAGSTLLLLGRIHDACGGSLYYQVLEELAKAPHGSLLGANVPEPDFVLAGKEIAFITSAIHDGHVLSCHDISDGGLLMALFEMSVPLRRHRSLLGAEIALDELPGNLQNDKLLFSQSGGFVIEVESRTTEHLVSQAESLSLPYAVIGSVTQAPKLSVKCEGKDLVYEDLADLHNVWRNGISSYFS
jgi:phosphoribosylformylglycinamidine synthase